MPRYRILFADDSGHGTYKDVESNSLAHALWEVAKQDGYGMTLVDTMELPGKSNLYSQPFHVNLSPNWESEED